MTRRWSRLTWPALAVRHASPWRRKMSATSSFGRRASWGLAKNDIIPLAPARAPAARPQIEPPGSAPPTSAAAPSYGVAAAVGGSRKMPSGALAPARAPAARPQIEPPGSAPPTSAAARSNGVAGRVGGSSKMTSVPHYNHSYALYTLARPAAVPLVMDRLEGLGKA